MSLLYHKQKDKQKNQEEDRILHLIIMLNKTVISDRVRELRVTLLSEFHRLENAIEEGRMDGKNVKVMENQLADLEDFIKAFNALNFRLLE